MKVNIKEARFTGILLEFSSANKLGCKVCKNINSRDNDYLFAVLERREAKKMYTKQGVVALIICKVLSKRAKIRNRYTIKYHT